MKEIVDSNELKDAKIRMSDLSGAQLRSVNFSNVTITDAWLAMNSSGPYGQGWVVYENNDEDVTRGVEAVAICAGS